MDASGVTLVVGGAVLVVVGWLSRLRLLPRNGLVGLRTPSTMRSRVGWREGHAAASTELLLSGLVAIVGGLLVELLPSGGRAVAVSTVVLVVGLVLLAGSKAIRVARAIEPEVG